MIPHPAQYTHTTKWIFESKHNHTPNPYDQWWFWTILYANSIVWTVFLFSSILKWNLRWILVHAFGITLAYTNVYGYWQCSKEQKAHFNDAIQAHWKKGISAGTDYSFKTGIAGNIMNGMFGFGNSKHKGNEYVSPPQTTIV